MEKNKIRLGVNIDHVATIRTNRNTDYPSLIDAVNIAINAEQPTYDAIQQYSMSQRALKILNFY